MFETIFDPEHESSEDQRSERTNVSHFIIKSLLLRETKRNKTEQINKCENCAKRIYLRITQNKTVYPFSIDGFHGAEQKLQFLDCDAVAREHTEHFYQQI